MKVKEIIKLNIVYIENEASLISNNGENYSLDYGTGLSGIIEFLNDDLVSTL